MIEKVWQRNSALLKATGLIGILLFVFWFGMEPHWDYKYPLHVDEWHAMGYTDAMLEEGSLNYDSPYGDAVIQYHQEMGFHQLVGFLKSSTGLSSMGLYRVAVGLVFSLLAFLVYVLGRRDGFGWIAALFVALIPTSIRTLGPTFFVPVAVAMLFVPVVLFILFRLGELRVKYAMLLLLLIAAGTLFIHPPSIAVIMGLVVLGLMLFAIESAIAKRYGEAGWSLVGIVVLIMIPLALLFRWLPSNTEIAFKETVIGDASTISYITKTLGFVTGFVEAFGVFALVPFVLGIFLLTLTRPYGLRTYVLPGSTVLLLFFLYVIFPRWEMGPNMLYERGWLYLGLFMTIIAGYAVAGCLSLVNILHLRLTRYLGVRRSLIFAQFSLLGVGVTLLVMPLVISLSNDYREDYAQYYHLAGQQIDADFTWLDHNTVAGDKTVLMELGLAWTYPVLAGPGNRVTNATASPYPTGFSGPVNEILNTGSVDADWLRENRVGVLYTRLPWSQKAIDIDNTELIKVRQGTYIVPAS